MKIDIYTQVYNEALIMPYFFKHYRRVLTGCDIVFHIFDNGSTDDTRQICSEHGANITLFETDGVRIDKMMHLKNNCWKASKADWVIVPDADEFINITKEMLQASKIDNIFRCYAYEMVGNTLNIDQIQYGVRTGTGFDRTCIFKPDQVKEMNWSMGAHTSDPVGNPCLIWSSQRPILYHMKYFSIEYVKARYKELAGRLTPLDIKNNWSYHYRFTDKKINQLFADLEKRKKIVRYADTM